MDLTLHWVLLMIVSGHVIFVQAVYGVLNAIEGCDAFSDVIARTDISRWYHAVKSAVAVNAGERQTAAGNQLHATAWLPDTVEQSWIKKMAEKNFHCCQYFWQLEKVIEVRVQTNHVTIPANANPRLMTLTLIPQWEYGHHLSKCMQQSAVSGQAVQHYSGNKCTDGFDRIYYRSQWCSW